MSVNIKIQNLKKKYGDSTVINNVSLDIKEGEFFTLLGPSGCGKTTLLRMIAGFNKIDEGNIYFNDELINDLKPDKRNIGMVFQDYAVFPNLNVEENVAYGLKANKVNEQEVKTRVERALNLVQIADLASRMPNEISGGQKQRVALARAIVVEPKVLLMDEPLSNLDAKFRVQMRETIKKLQRKLGITVIYVTHDQEEALAISDRIAIMNNGIIEQIGTPKEIYNNPINKFVASFIGRNNFIDVQVKDHKTYIGDYAIDIKDDIEGNVILAIRPEYVFFDTNGLECEITFITYLGDYIEYEVTINKQVLFVHEYTKYSDRNYKIGDKVYLSFDLDRVKIYNND